MRDQKSDQVDNGQSQDGVASDTLTQVTHEESEVINVITNLFGELRQEIRSDLSKFKTKVDDRLSHLELEISEKLKKTVAEAVDEAVKSQMDTIKQHVDKEVERLDRKMERIANSMASVNDFSKNFIVKSLPTTENEDLGAKVDQLLRDGLGLHKVQIDSVERKAAFLENVPGVVVVTCQSREERDKVLKEKKKLKEHRQFSHVYVQSDKPKKERRYEANLRLLVKTLGEGTLEVHGDRLCKKQSQQHGQGRPGRGRSSAQRGGGRGNQPQATSRQRAPNQARQPQQQTHGQGSA